MAAEERSLSPAILTSPITQLQNICQTQDDGHGQISISSHSWHAILVGFEGCLSVRGRGDERTKNNICASLTMFVLLKFNCLSSHCFPTLLQIVSQERALISSAYHCLLEMFSPLSPGPSLGQMFTSSVMIGCQQIKSTPFLLIIV